MDRRWTIVEIESDAEVVNKPLKEIVQKLSSLTIFTTLARIYVDITQNEHTSIHHTMKSLVWSKVVHDELQALVVNGT